MIMLPSFLPLTYTEPFSFGMLYATREMANEQESNTVVVDSFEYLVFQEQQTRCFLAWFAC
jgi:hypothetical protein